MPHTSDHLQKEALEHIEAATEAERCRKRLREHLTRLAEGHAEEVLRNKRNKKKIWKEDKA